jgi:hypothetical protein
VYIIEAPFGVVACLACFFLGDLKSVMNYSVDAPVEDLRAKHPLELDISEVRKSYSRNGEIRESTLRRLAR